MPSPRLLRSIAVTCTAGLFASAAITAYAAPSEASESCDDPNAVTLIDFSDLHGRITNAAFFETIEAQRAAAGADNTLLIAGGDSIGGSIFESMLFDDEPTIEMLNAIGLDASAVGNHEFDRGRDFLENEVIGGQDGYTPAEFPYLSANIEGSDAIKPYTILTAGNGQTVAFIGATTAALPSLVAGTGLEGLTVTDPVDAVNALIAATPEITNADYIVADFHEGTEVTSDLAAAEAASETFNRMANDLDERVDAIFTGHTHTEWAWVVPDGDGVRPMSGPGNYGEALSVVTLSNGIDGELGCFTQDLVTSADIDETTLPADAQARLAEISTIRETAVAEAQVVGAQVLGETTADLSRGTAADLTSPGSNRAVESTLTDQVANMFYDVLSNGNEEFIGVQNPGGTRADLLAEEVTYSEAAAVLPFANTLMTRQLTGAQVKLMLEQQWQVDSSGTPITEGRPYLQLGLSANVSYTYDESRELGDRITSVTINNNPLDPEKLYTLGSGNFLIDGGDNFHVFLDGINRTDSGRIDLEAWVDWISDSSPLSPSFARRAVSVHELPTTLTAGVPVSLQVGAAEGDALAADTLNMRSLGAPQATSVTATLVSAGGSTTEVGSAAVTDGSTELTITVPASLKAGSYTLKIAEATTGTTVTSQVTIKAATAAVKVKVTGVSCNGATFVVSGKAPKGSYLAYTYTTAKKTITGKAKAKTWRLKDKNWRTASVQVIDASGEVIGQSDEATAPTSCKSKGPKKPRKCGHHRYTMD